jgi:solute carrier family 25 aspartate/glutamate transporter 12/13
MSSFSITELFTSPKESFSEIFNKNAIIENGVRILPRKAFFNHFLGMANVRTTEDEVEIFYKIASKDKQYIEYQDFIDFESILVSDHCEFEMIMALLNGNLENIDQFITKTNIGNIENFGKFNLKNYADFTEFIQFVRGERLKKLKDCDWIPMEVAKELFAGTNFKHLFAMHFSNGISFPELYAVSSLYSKIDGISYLLAKVKGDTVSKSDLAQLSNKKLLFTSFSPLEIDVLFKLTGGTKQVLQVTDFYPLINPSFRYLSSDHPISKLSASMELIKSVYNFTLGSIAGAIGAAAVYPIGNIALKKIWLKQECKTKDLQLLVRYYTRIVWIAFKKL